MDFDRYQALGRWSEWAGPAGLDRDHLMCAAGMDRTAKLDYEVARPQARAMLNAYAAGVNAFLATTTALPVEYHLLDQRPEPWSWHYLAVYKMHNSLLGTLQRPRDPQPPQNRPRLQCVVHRGRVHRFGLAAYSRSVEDLHQAFAR